jgi:hypothetical protein
MRQLSLLPDWAGECGRLLHLLTDTCSASSSLCSSNSTFVSHAELETLQSPEFVEPALASMAAHHALNMQAPLLPAGSLHSQVASPMAATPAVVVACAANVVLPVASAASGALSPASVSSSSHVFPAANGGGGGSIGLLSKPKFHLQIANSDAPVHAAASDEEDADNNGADGEDGAATAAAIAAEGPVPERKSKRQRSGH